MTDLIKRLQKADGPDRELDAIICAQLLAFNHPVKEWDVPFVAKKINKGHLNDWFVVTRDVEFDAPGGYAFQVPEYTASLDATLALVAEALPGASVQMYIVSAVIGRAEIGFNRKVWSGRHKSPAISLLIALLQTQTKDNSHE